MIEFTITPRDRALAPGGIPRWIRIYDNGGLCSCPTWERDHKPKRCCNRGSSDRYTIVFTGRYTHRTLGEHWYLASSVDPYWPQGIGLSGTSRGAIDKPSRAGLGRRTKFEDLPTAVQDFVLTTYFYLWDIGAKWEDVLPRQLARLIQKGLEPQEEPVHA